jgi:uncharacterized delta-60 repeat protein
MKKFGSIRELVSTVFSKDSQQVTLRPNSTTTYTNNRIVDLPPEDASGVLMSASSPATMTNKTFDANGTGNSLSNIANANISNSAAIEVSKLSAGSNSQVLTTVAGVPTWATASGGSVPNPTTMTDTEATRLGYKIYLSNAAYNSGIIPTITSSVSVENPITNAALIPYQTQDGGWRLKGLLFKPASLPQVYEGMGTTDNATFYTNTKSTGDGSGFTAEITGIGVQSTGSIIVGFVGRYNSTVGPNSHLVKLNADGTEDISFYPTTDGIGWFGNNITSVLIQPDNKIIVTGTYFYPNYTFYRWGVIRLNSDGTDDATFSTNMGTGTEGVNQISAAALQSDGKIILTGSFQKWNGPTRNGLIRLNANGTEDTTFATNVGTAFNTVGSGNNPSVIVVQPDDKILIGGYFTTFKGISRKFLIRLNSDGTEDTTFYTNLGTAFNNTVLSLAVQSDGTILVGGMFTTFNGATRNCLVRLNSTGTEDSTFATNIGTGFNGDINSLQVFSSLDPSATRIGVYGSFSTFKGATREQVVQLNLDGTENTAFATGMGTAFGSNRSVKTTAQLSDSVLIGGNFTTFKGASRKSFIKLNRVYLDPITSSVTYTFNGVTFSSTGQQVVLSDRASGFTTAGASTLSLATIAGAANLPNGATFDVELASKPTWAY